MRALVVALSTIIACAPVVERDASDSQPDVPSNAGDACETESDCTPSLECVALDGAAAQCTIPKSVGETCACAPTESGACAVERSADGCTDELRCIGARFNGIDVTSSDPVCGHSPALANERCGWTNAIGVALDCAEGLECAFGVGICVPADCETDDDCAAPAVCVRACRSACGPPAELSDTCHLDGFEMCAFDRSCGAGLTCNPVGLDDQNGERRCE